VTGPRRDAEAKYGRPPTRRGSMDLVSTLAQNLGLVAFTVLSVGILLYLLYAMLNPTRF